MCRRSRALSLLKSSPACDAGRVRDGRHGDRLGARRGEARDEDDPHARRRAGDAEDQPEHVHQPVLTAEHDVDDPRHPPVRIDGVVALLLFGGDVFHPLLKSRGHAIGANAFRGDGSHERSPCKQAKGLRRLPTLQVEILANLSGTSVA